MSALATVLTRFFGSRNQRLLRRMQQTVAAIEAQAQTMSSLSDEALRQTASRLRQHLAQGQTLEQVLPDMFAAVREAASRTLGLRHFPVQLLGGLALHEGKIAERRTGEGKTLVATLAASLNALTGHGVHVVTVNEYLARRDAEWMRPVYEAVGLSVGVVLAEQGPEEKRAKYACDVVYATNNELGFDYLRDNMAFSMEDKVQRELCYAIVDEVDSILIDEARTPLIISGASSEDVGLYTKLDAIVPRLIRQDSEEGHGDFWVDEKARQVYLSEEGHHHVEEMLVEAGLIEAGASLYEASQIVLMHHVMAALRAHHLFRRNVDYIVRNNEIIIVDEFTGRLMPGRRWSDGLHQAIEAKEGVPIQRENQTLASITFQNFFRLYDKLAGMTGTADTEAYEFQEIYGLEVVVIPTNKPMIRVDHPDLVFLRAEAKMAAVIEEIKEAHERNQPVLVGTASIEASEQLSTALRQQGLPHEVLNAKNHEREAEIIAQAGRPGSVTIATNMAGRGTDIVLGGNFEAMCRAIGKDPKDREDDEVKALHVAWQTAHEAVLASGGLYVIGSERNESRRVDNQLRGRAGRQGDPGSSRFFVSLEDNLLRIFGSHKRIGMLQRLGVRDDEVIEHRLTTRFIENAQKKVEAHNFDIRKQLLEYDNVGNEQRKVIYQLRNELLGAEDMSGFFQQMRHKVLRGIVERFVPEQASEDLWDVSGLTHFLSAELFVELPVASWLEAAETHEAFVNQVLDALEQAYLAKWEGIEGGIANHVEKWVQLRVLDNLWREHLVAMDYLRQGIHLRGYAQRDPKQEYKKEAFSMFGQMVATMEEETVITLFQLQMNKENPDAALPPADQQPEMLNLTLRHDQAPSLPLAAEDDVVPSSEEGGEGSRKARNATERQPATEPDEQASAPYVRAMPKVGRNEPCPCGSGKKFKHCHGALS
jgi:preprotein translocase subunit SecA